MFIPIGTDFRTRGLPLANWILIGLNVLIFGLTDVVGGGVGQFMKAWFTLDAGRPVLYQYVTYQFLHGDVLHLAGNMLFLWIFGNAVCDRMGSLAYALFYLAGGVSAGVGFAMTAQNPMLGASGAIAAVTTAFLVLFPRVHVTMLLWLFIVTTIQVPAMILIVFKIILWDNVLAPSFDHGVGSSVAYSAHIAGYVFGFSVSLLMLAIGALPRNQFDMLSLWNRYGRRRGLALATGPALGPRMARPVRVEAVHSRPLEALPLSAAERLREEVLSHLEQRDGTAAIASFAQLTAVEPQHVLPRPQQLDIANYLAQARQYDRAAAAYEGFLTAYPASPDVPQVRLLLGIISRRHLGNFDAAARTLRSALDGLTHESQRDLALEELALAEARVPGDAG